MTSRSLRPVLATAGLLLALTLTGCGDDEPADSSAPTATATAGSSAPSAAPVGPTLDFTVSGDKIDPVNQRIDAKAGDTLVVTVTADRAGELHVHTSPEQEVEFETGTTRLEIQLEKPGQVDIEEHASDTLVARVLVK